MTGYNTRVVVIFFPGRCFVSSPRCPYLGLENDPETCYAFPSESNYCFRLSEPHAIEASHQSGYCLTPAYTRCKIFQRAALEARRQVAQPRSNLDPESRKRAATLMMWLSASALLITLVVGLYFFDWTPVSAMLFGRHSPTPTQPQGFVLFGSQGTQVISSHFTETPTPLPPRPTETPIPSPTDTPVPTDTPPPPTPTPFQQWYPSATPVVYPTATFTPLPPTPTETPTVTPTQSVPSPSPTVTPSPSFTPLPSATPTPSDTPVPTDTPLPTDTPAPTPTATLPGATATSPPATPTLIITPVATKTP